MPHRRPARALLAALALAALGGASGQSCLPKPKTAHPEVLVVYNENDAPDALTIAAYYALKRDLSGDQLCPVALPTGQFASADELLAARRTIVEQCLCPLIPATARPDPCDVDHLDDVRAASEVSHLALIRGIPPRLYGTPWPSDDEEPSFDFYLSYLVYHGDDLFAPGTVGLTTTDYLTPDLIDQASDYAILSAPPLDPAQHRDVAYGRIEAMDVDRTFQLIDRTLEAERLGLRGNFLEEKGNRNFRFLQDLTGSHAPACTGYITHEPFLYDTPESSWPHELCRAGTTFVTAHGPDPGSSADDPRRGVVPADALCTVPRAVDVGLLLGSTPGPNQHSGFNHFDVLTRWRRSGEACTPLCADLPTQPERDACAASSSDYFRQLDTDCVGVARGFLGHQIRSWPVQYYGFWPAGWNAPANGAAERTPPGVRTGGAYQDPTHPDDRYLHFGRHDAENPDDSTCPVAGGTREPCPERIAVQLEQGVDLSPALPVSGSRTFLVWLRHRNPANPGGGLRVRIDFESGAASVSKQAVLPLDAPAAEWSVAGVPLTISQAELGQIDGLRLSLSAGLGDQLYGYLDLDAVELVDLETGAGLIDPEIGSFAAPAQDQTHPGDWAANAIDRLGAVAWWGSSSHHLTGGWAFSYNTRFFGALFMGRTLGESLALTGGGVSGIVYGDPLYRPAAVRLHLPGYQDYGEAPGLVVPAAALPEAGTVLVNALLGTERVDTTRWSVASCPIHDVVLCDDGGAWTERESGVGAVVDHPVDWSAFVDPGAAQDLLLRLRVWNPGEEEDQLFSYAYLHYTP